jgi:cell division septation protein DedD
LTILLLIVIGATGFLLGFLCGRWSAPVAAVQASSPPPMVAVVRPPAEPSAAAVTAAPQVANAGTEGASAAAPPPTGVAAPVKDEMTYHDTLTKGEAPPLGSGINLPPPGNPVSASAATDSREVARAADKPAALSAPAAAAAVSRPAAKVQSTATAASATAKAAGNSKSAPAGKSPATQEVAAKAAGTATFVVQTASFRKADDAEALKKRLEKKRFTAFVEAIEVSGKGIWHRVLVGPFGNAADADVAARQLKGFERMNPVVKKR